MFPAWTAVAKLYCALASSLFRSTSDFAPVAILLFAAVLVNELGDTSFLLRLFRFEVEHFDFKPGQDTRVLDLLRERVNTDAERAFLVQPARRYDLLLQRFGTFVLGSGDFHSAFRRLDHQLVRSLAELQVLPQGFYDLQLVVLHLLLELLGLLRERELQLLNIHRCFVDSRLAFAPQCRHALRILLRLRSCERADSGFLLRYRVEFDFQFVLAHADQALIRLLRRCDPQRLLRPVVVPDQREHFLLVFLLRVDLRLVDFVVLRGFGFSQRFLSSFSGFLRRFILMWSRWTCFLRSDRSHEGFLFRLRGCFFV